MRYVPTVPRDAALQYLHVKEPSWKSIPTRNCVESSAIP
jgi:hypothetical protein